MCSAEWGDPRIRPEVWRNIHPEPNTGCWLWSGYINGDGYGRGYPVAQGRLVMAHRITWEALIAPLEDGMELDHLCRTRPCCNPQHLESVTHVENTRRAAAQLTHCKHGHEFSAENTLFVPREGYTLRKCLVCRERSNKQSVVKLRIDPELREHRNRLAREKYARRKIIADAPIEHASAVGAIMQHEMEQEGRNIYGDLLVFEAEPEYGFVWSEKMDQKQWDAWIAEHAQVAA